MENNNNNKIYILKVKQGYQESGSTYVFSSYERFKIFFTESVLQDLNDNSDGRYTLTFPKEFKESYIEKHKYAEVDTEIDENVFGLFITYIDKGYFDHLEWLEKMKQKNKDKDSEQ